MADKKISALTAATTPLAGTEVLPVVQGGSTVKVSVANLTAGRDIATKNISATGDVGIGVSPSAKLHVSVGSSPNIAQLLVGYLGGSETYYDSNTQIFRNGSFAETMRITSTGAVGINETNPDYKLDVNGSIGFTPGSSVTPVDNGDVVFEFTNNTTLTVKAKGSDGVVRSVALTLA